MITCIAACNRFGTLGLDGKMPWHVKADLKHFKAYTMGKDLLMGRVTYEGLPKSLKGRNIHVYTSNPTFPNRVADLDSFLQQYREQELVVCGGGQLYQKMVPLCDRLLLSFVTENDVLGDAFFPNFSLQDFKMVKWEAKEGFNLATYERLVL